MSWQDDPEFEAVMRVHRVRSGLIRTAIVWTPLFLISLGACIFFIVDTATGPKYGGTWVLVIVLAIATFLFGFQAIQALLDLNGLPTTESGVVQRRWARRDSFVFQTQYMRIGKHILRGDPLLLADIHERDFVEVEFFPHSSVIVHVAKVARPEGDDTEADT